MNRITSIFALLIMSACISTHGRQTALVPAIRTAWPGVQADIQEGISDAAATGLDTSAVSLAVSQLDSAVASGDQLLVAATPWAAIEPYGQRGIDAQVTRGSISVLIAPSLRERLRRFGEAIAKMRILP